MRQRERKKEKERQTGTDREKDIDEERQTKTETERSICREKHMRVGLGEWLHSGTKSRRLAWTRDRFQLPQMSTQPSTR